MRTYRASLYGLTSFLTDSIGVTAPLRSWTGVHSYHRGGGPSGCTTLNDKNDSLIASIQPGAGILVIEVEEVEKT